MELIDILFRIDEHIDNWIRILDLYQHYLEFAKEVYFPRLKDSRTWKFDSDSFITARTPESTNIKTEPLYIIKHRLKEYKEYFRKLPARYEREKPNILNVWERFEKDANSILGITYVVDERNSILSSLTEKLNWITTDIEDDLSRYIEYADDGTEKIDSKCGQWVYAHDLAGMHYYRCTNCADAGVETFATEVEVKWWKYCPRCGAKMQIKNTEQEKEPVES